jgi:cytochrome c oxidase assembly protein subunit 15
VPLIVFGGSVTTLEAGMAIEGWLVLEPGRGDHFLFFYPLEKWFRDAGTFVEHTHRLFGSLVGMLAIATVVATFASTRRRGARGVASAALLAVCAQGAIGGLRVLENSPKLAFLHGALGQAVFALLAVGAVVLCPRFARAERRTDQAALELRRAAFTALGVVYATIFLGAWLRHASSSAALVAHVLGVLLSAALLLGLIGRLQTPECAHLAGARRRLIALLAAQFALGLASFWMVFFVAAPGEPAVHQSVFPTLHVLFGALLLGQTAAVALWADHGQPVALPRGSENARLRAGVEGAA